MKKTMIFFIMACLLVSSVLGATRDFDNMFQISTADKSIGEDILDDYVDSDGKMIKNMVNERIRIQGFGLNGSTLMIRNENTTAKLEQVWNKISQTKQNRINALDDVVIVDLNDSMEFTGKKEAKFLWMFNVQERVTYVASEDGAVDEKKGFGSWMYNWMWTDR